MLLLITELTIYETVMAMRSVNHDYKDLIRNLYKDKNGFSISEQDRANILKNGGAPTYGEILPEGIDKLISNLNLNNGVLYDLGSGTGYMILYCALQYHFKKCIGIELSQDRYNIAVEVKQKLSNLQLASHASFQNINFLNVPIADANVVYISNLCFGDELNANITHKLNTELSSGTKVFSSKALDQLNANLDQTDTVCMSWEGNSAIRHYTML